jgi:hypothetical protein
MESMQPEQFFLNFTLMLHSAPTGFNTFAAISGALLPLWESLAANPSTMMQVTLLTPSEPSL